MANSSNARLTKNERRDQAREQARLAREQEQKREKRRRLTIQGSIVLGVLAILGVVALVLTQNMRPAGPGPENMASGGVVIEEGLTVREGPALQDGDSRVAPVVDRTKAPLDVTIYVDYSCSHCASFEQQYGEMLQNQVESGNATLQIYPVNILDTSATSNYSTRAANALSCLVDQGADDGVVFSFHNSLLSADTYNRVSEEGGLSDETLIEFAEQAGATADTDLKQCINQQRFASFIAQNTAAATQDGILGLEEDTQLYDDASAGTLQEAGEPQKLRGTPLVIVNGQLWTENLGSLQTYLEKLKSSLDENGDASDEEATAEDVETE